MSSLKYVTAGESHGPALTAIVEGMPAGLTISQEDINKELSRRQHQAGRGPRLKTIESDRVVITGGIRWGETLGSPVCLTIPNKDWENWKIRMSAGKEDKNDNSGLTTPRPGHADLAGMLKFDRRDVQDILERASARETAARSAVGAICKKLLAEFNIRVVSVVTEIGGIMAELAKSENWESLGSKAEESPARCPDAEAADKIQKTIATAAEEGDTLGGAYTVAVLGCPPGLGSHVSWETRLDARLGMALLSIQAHKGVEFGAGFDLARMRGSVAHDEIFYDKTRGFYRKTNFAGGIEGGMTNGEPVVVHAVVKPVASLSKPLMSVDISSKKATPAAIVRSDVCPVASASIVGESCAAIVIAQCLREKFGGDSLREMKANFSNYLEQIKQF